MNFKQKFIDFALEPERSNIKSFLEEYLKQTNAFFNLADTDIASSIDEAEQQVLKDKQLCKASGIFQSMNETQIKNYFQLRRLELYKSIPKDIATIATRKIDYLLNENKLLAKKIGLYIPEDYKLTTAQYYANYLKGQQILKEIIFILGHRK